MTADLIVPIALLIGVTVWMAIAHVMRGNHARLQQEIASKGALCQGRVTAIQRPFLLDSCTRLYFEFEPLGADTLVQCCHVDRRSDEEQLASLPPAGTVVTVRYLPQRPTRAVIGKLVTSFA